MAISRYRNTGLISNSFQETFEFPLKEDLDLIPTVQIVANQFDRLDNLAHVHFGDGQYWWILSLINDIDWPYNIEERTNSSNSN